MKLIYQYQYHIASSGAPANILPFAICIFAVSAYLILGSYYDCDFLLDNHSARRTTSLIGRWGARILFTVFGIVLALVGVIGVLAYLQESP